MGTNQSKYAQGGPTTTENDTMPQATVKANPRPLPTRRPDSAATDLEPAANPIDRKVERSGNVYQRDHLTERNIRRFIVVRQDGTLTAYRSHTVFERGGAGCERQPPTQPAFLESHKRTGIALAPYIHT